MRASYVLRGSFKESLSYFYLGIKIGGAVDFQYFLSYAYVDKSLCAFCT